jgi:hypothetical protein
MKMHQYARVVVALLLAVALFGCSASKPAVQAGVTVTDIDVGRSVTADKTIAEKTDSFRPADTFYVSVKTDGSGPSATLTARWTYQDGKWSTSPSRTSPLGQPPSPSSTCPSRRLAGGRIQGEVLLNGTSPDQDFKVT